jgi:Zn-finger nucleic acid-binding protein
MHCPRCEQSTLDEREREGITVDICRSCRGVWLDRGELEKLIARATRDLDEPLLGQSGPAPEQHSRPAQGRSDAAYGRSEPSYRRDDTPPRGTPRYGESASGHHYDPRKKKRHWLESLGDIFD